MDKKNNLMKRLFTLIITVIMVAQVINMAGFEYEVSAAESADYVIKINVALNYLSVYSKTDTQNPVKTFPCSAPSQNLPNPAQTVITAKNQWLKNADNTFSMFDTELGNGLKICTSPYSQQKNDALITDLYNKIGDAYSGTNIYLNYAQAKWIYENVAAGVSVEFYSDANAADKSKKEALVKIPADSQYNQWDPTTDDAANPWKTQGVKIEGAMDVYTKVGVKPDLYATVKAKDTCGNDITDKIIVSGNYNINKAGEYSLTYTVSDSTGSMDGKTVKIVVSEDESKETVSSTKKSSGGVITVKSGKSSSGNLQSGKNVVETRSNGQKVKGILILMVASLAVAIIIIKITKARVR